MKAVISLICSLTASPPSAVSSAVSERVRLMTAVPDPVGSKNGSPAGTSMLNASPGSVVGFPGERQVVVNELSELPDVIRQTSFTGGRFVLGGNQVADLAGGDPVLSGRGVKTVGVVGIRPTPRNQSGRIPTLDSQDCSPFHRTIECRTVHHPAVW